MNTINLQNKTTAKKGIVEIFWFENKKIGLEKTLFHRMNIPLTPFDSGVAEDTQPLETEIVIDWLNLNLRDPLNMDKLILKSTPEDDSGISIQIGNAFNPCDIQRMAINRVSDNLYEIDCELFVDFEHEGTAKNEVFKFKTEVVLDTEIMG